jgi:hypothetical protein
MIAQFYEESAAIKLEENAGVIQIQVSTSCGAHNIADCRIYALLSTETVLNTE